MPELYFEIKPTLSGTSVSEIEKKLDELQKKYDQAFTGSSGSQGEPPLNKPAEATEKLNTKLQRLIKLNEVRFRQDKISQANALKNAKLLERAAINQGLLNDKTIKGVNTQKTLYLSQQRIETGFKGVATSSATANRGLVNLGRIVQDLPFGFLGISNNIDPMLQSFKQLKQETGSNVGAFKALISSLSGGGGLIFALGSLLPTAFLVAQNGMNMYSKKSKEVVVDTKDVIKALSELRDFGTFSFLDRNSIEREIATIQDMRPALDQIVSAQMAVQRAQESTPGFVVNKGSDYFAEIQNLKNLEEQFGFTYKEAQELIELQSDLNAKLKTINAQSSFAQLAKYREELEKSTDKTKLLVGSGLRQSEMLEALAKKYFREARVLKEAGLQTDEQRVKYELLMDTARDLVQEYEGLQDAVKVNQVSVEKEVTGVERLTKAHEDARKEAELAKKAEKNNINAIITQPSDNLTNDQAQKQAETAQQLLVDRQILQAEGLAKKKLEIENKYNQKILQLGKQGLLSKEVLNQIELNKSAELEVAKTQISKQEAENRKQIQQQVLSSTFGLINNYFSSLSQLNQAQSDETEVQARKKFEKEKKLQRQSAIVAGFQSVARQFADLPLWAAIPASLFTAKITSAQIKAINRTKFESGETSGARVSSSSGFSTSSVQPQNTESRTRVNRDVVQISNPVAPVNITLEGEFDDELVSVRARRGDDKRKRQTSFTV